MGRGKIEMKRIENSNNRQVAVLCNAKVSVAMFGSSGKMQECCCPPNSIVSVLDQYHNQSGKRLWEAKHEGLSFLDLTHEVDSMKKENDNLQIKHLKGQDIASINYREPMILEDCLENGLTCIGNQKDEVIKLIGRM